MFFLGVVTGVAGLSFVLYRDYRYNIGWYLRTMWLFEAITSTKKDKIIEVKPEEEGEF